MPTKSNGGPKHIVYLFGAGATQAEVDYLGAQVVNLLMHDSDRLGDGVSTRILRRFARNWQSFLGEEQDIDIEKLISLLAASGVDKLANLAEKMRRHYFEEIQESLVRAKIVARPQLATGLLEMHTDRRFKSEVETLCGIMTTNHDGLLQIASQNVFGAVNLGFAFSSKEFVPANSRAVPPVLQLHGSFTWRFALPLDVDTLRSTATYSPKTLWIPPSILKESKTYPFNKLTALAYELLTKQCDVLRVVGASLTQNDWNVLSLVFNAQRHRELVKGSAFKVELIMPHKTGEDIQEECSYLKNTTPVGYLTEGEFADYKEGLPPPESQLTNVFAYWLKEKIQYHRRRGDFSRSALTPMMAAIAGEAS